MADVQADPVSVSDEVRSSAPPAKDPSTTEDVATTSHDAQPGADTNGDLKSTNDDISMGGVQPSIDGSLVKEADKATSDATDAAPGGDITPAAGKSKRKSTGGVPEHKSKKLNKKKSTVTLNLDLEAGDMVWARLKGHPPWPSVVCDEQMLPESLLGSRPVSTKRPDGTYREDFMEGGKSAKDRTYPVMFFATNEFAWMPNTQLTRLQASEVDPDTEKKLQPSLRSAYRIASEGHDLDYFKELLRQHEAEVKEFAEIEQQEAERKAAEAAEKAERKAEKERRKSKAGNDDAMDVDTEKPSKKRKKEAGSDGEGPKTKKTPKVKLSTKEAKPEAVKKSKPKKKAQEPVEQDIPESVRLDRREQASKCSSPCGLTFAYKRVALYLRHRLQKGFLSSTVPPKDEDMPSMADYFKQLEQHKDLEPQIIRNTKIHKVLKNILRLAEVPRDEEFNFKKRSQEMLDHWNEVLSAPANGKAEDSATNGEAKVQEPKEGTNGTSEKGKAEAESKPTEIANGGDDAREDADVSMLDSSVLEAKKDEPDEIVKDEEDTVKTEAGAEEHAKGIEGTEKSETAAAPAAAEATATT